jgi:serine/threonine-protein kinase
LRRYLLVTFDGGVKVLDFGIAKARSRLVETRQGVVKGRVSYVAPERVVGRPHDRRVDVFSLGVVLWEVITGQRLYRRRSDLESLEAIVAGEVPRPRSVNGDCPEELERIVLRMLATDQAERYPDCRLVQEDLEQFVASSGYVVTAQRLGQWVARLFEGAPQRVPQWLKKARDDGRPG